MSLENVIDLTQARREMMQLWIDTFHDSEDYVNLIFNNYFNPKYCRVAIENGHVAAALVGVPYTFKGFFNDVIDQNDFSTTASEKLHTVDKGLRGLYLCGLATKEEYRRRGLMSRLIEDINAAAKNDGFDFTFLIPSGPDTAMYYSERGYVSAMYRCVSRFPKNYDFLHAEQNAEGFDMSHYEHLKAKMNDTYDSRLLYKIYNLIFDCERNGDYLDLNHSVADIDMVLEDCRLSGGKLFYVYENSDNVTAAAFVTPHDEEVVIPRIYYKDRESRVKLLDLISNSFTDKSLKLYSYPQKIDRKAIWSPYYEAQDARTLPEDPDAETTSHKERIYNYADHADMYGMLRLLSAENVRKLLPVIFSDLNYEQREVIESLSAEKNLHEFAEIVFRKMTSSDYVGVAFEVPRLSLNMSYLLD